VSSSLILVVDRSCSALGQRGQLGVAGVEVYVYVHLETWGRKQIRQFPRALIFRNNMWLHLAGQRMNKQTVLGEAGKGLIKPDFKL